MDKTYFITATGTDIGKTWLTAGLLAACRAQGRPARALKPIMSGYDPARHADSDIAKINPPTPSPALAGGETVCATANECSVESISPWRFAAPLSPDRAAAKEGKAIDFAALVGWCRGEVETNDGLLLIEGVGGVMVPLTARHTVRDWIAALEIPALLVCGTYLGALSHTLTALVALRAVGVVPAMLIVNESAGSTVSLEDTLASLTPHVGDIPVVVVRREDADGVARLAETLLNSR